MKMSAAVAGLLASGALAHVGMGGTEEGKNMLPAAQPMDTVERGGMKTDGDNINVSGRVDSDLGDFHKRDDIDPVKVDAGAGVDADADVNVKGHVKRDEIDPVKVDADAGVDADADVKGHAKRDRLRWAKRDRKAKTGVARREMPVPGSQQNGQGRNRENDPETESDCSGSDTDCERRGKGHRGRRSLRRRAKMAKKAVEDGNESRDSSEGELEII
ncbi:hypothetical protein ATEIFO6365_0002023700 [Aspergillus terreus]|uniref:Uncharacterized protein n=1 Tax=Aspergillus terreus TaxID=33178 RepID=A0A5M3YVU6_ASPTE|nr:hypothetical protein ATETN484_0004023700 [Aspergillus terreus]GFF13127.1 hypothetical protein ATEIFO6365_0002023700 [Aspergillus terreus]